MEKKIFSFFFLLVFAFLQKTKCNKYVVTPFGKIVSGYILVGSIDDSSYMFKANMMVDVSFSKEILGLNETSSKIKVKGNTFRTDINHYSNILVRDVTSAFRLKNTSFTLPEFNFYLVKNTEKDYLCFDSISLSYRHKDRKYSVTHQLYDMKLIDHLSFGFIPLDDNKGDLYFGKIPEDQIYSSGKTFKYKCYIDTSQNYWGCNMKYVYLNDKVGEGYVNTDPAYFDSSLDAVYVPKKYFDYLVEIFFQKLIDKNICSLSTVGNKLQISCMCEAFSNFSSITFIFGSIEITIGHKQIYEKIFNSCHFNLKHMTIYEKEWVFGTYFFKNYTSLFDYEDGSITFYSNTSLTYNDIEKRFPEKFSSLNVKLMLIIINAIIITLCIPLLIYFLFTKV